MPSRLSDSIRRALLDSRVSIGEVQNLIRKAKAEVPTPEIKAELQSLLDLHADKFGSSARRDLQEFLTRMPVRTTPTPAVPQQVTTPAVTTPAPQPAVTTRSVVALPDPAVLSEHATDITWKPVTDGKLYVDGVSYDDVVQGSIGDCYVVGALAAVAHASPANIEKAIRDNGNGTYTVRFHEKQATGVMKPVDVTVDGDIAQNSFGGQKYATSRNKSELWVALVEKAFAQWKGGYDAIGKGGRGGAVVEALMGKATVYTSATYFDANTVFSRIQAGATASRPMVAPTYGKDSSVNYSGTGVYAWHVYTVLGAVEEAGTRYVQLRNPWGSSEPGNDGKNDGIFKMKLEDFVKLYQGVEIG